MASLEIANLCEKLILHIILNTPFTMLHKVSGVCPYKASRDVTLKALNTNAHHTFRFVFVRNVRSNASFPLRFPVMHLSLLEYHIKSKQHSLKFVVPMWQNVKKQKRPE